MSLLGVRSIRHKQAKVFWPSIFIAHEPQIPSRQERRKVRVGSRSFFILMRASKTFSFTLVQLKRTKVAGLTIGPVWLRSSSYVCSVGFFAGSSGFFRVRVNPMLVLK